MIDNVLVSLDSPMLLIIPLASADANVRMQMFVEPLLLKRIYPDIGDDGMLAACNPICDICLKDMICI